MSALESQSLASGREPRLKKTTQRAQQMLEEQQQRNDREKKAKAAAIAGQQPKLLDDKGDGFLYGPAESYAPPTLTGDDKLDLLRFDEAEASHILKLLAHRGDGDWQVQFQERQIDLEDLRQARDNPDANILKRKVKGKARAVDDEHEGETLGSRHETIYTGITIGRSPPADSSYRQDAGDARSTLQLGYPPPTPLPLPKRPAPSQNEEPRAKKPRVEPEGDQDSNRDHTPAKARKPAQALPSHPTVEVAEPAATRPKKPATKLSYGGPQPLTNLQLVSYGGSTPRQTTPWVANSQPNKPPIEPSVQERPRQDPLGLDHQETLPHKAHRPLLAQSNDDRLYSVPPQPRSFVYQPPSKKTHSTGHNAASQVPVSTNSAAVDADRDNYQPRKQAGLVKTASNRPDATPVVAHERASAMVKGRGAPRDQHKEPLDAPPGRVRTDYASARPDLIPERKPKRAPEAAKKRGVPHAQAQQPPVVPQAHKARVGARPDPIPTPKRAPHTAKKQGVRHEQAKEPPVAPQAHKARTEARPAPVPMPKRAPNVAKKRGVSHVQAEEPAAEYRVAKIRAAARPDPIRKRASDQAKRRGAVHGGIEEAIAGSRISANRLARNKRSPAPNPQGLAALADDDDDQEGDETAVEEDDDENIGAAHIYRFVSSNTPTVNSYPPEVQPVMKLTARQAKPWIVSCGTFDWREGDPGEKAPTSDAIVARCFAHACRELQKRLVFRDDHVKTVGILITTYRHHTKAVIMALIEKDGEFADDRPKYNRKLSAWLLPDAFHEAEPESKKDRRPFESNLMPKAIARTLFGPNNYGLKFAERFNPIPLRFLAFVCCMMNHVIYCYRGGYFDKKDRLVSTQQELAFRHYLDLLGEMQRNRPTALRQICGRLYDQARLEASRAETRVEAPQPPRKWAPDIQEEYISQYKAPTPPPDHENEDAGPLPRVNGLKRGGRVEQREPHRGPTQANEGARHRAPPQKKPNPHTKKPISRPGPSDEETNPARVQSSRQQYGHRAIDDSSDRGEGPSRPYGVPAVDEDGEDEDGNWDDENDEDEDENRGGPSRPYGIRPVSEEDTDDNLPSPRRVLLQSVSEPSDPELEPSGPEEEED